MTVAAADLARLRRMIAEPTTTTYSDALLTAAVERYPVMDSAGEFPTEIDGDANDDWTETYDLFAAAADLLEEKAATMLTAFDFNADNGSFRRSQQYDHMMDMARRFRARRQPATFRMQAEPKPDDLLWGWQLEGYVVNVAEESD